MTTFPGRSQLRQTSAAIGRDLTEPERPLGFVDDGLLAHEERIRDARRQWRQASAEDFEHLGKRAWRDKATGVEYRRAEGNPLLTVGTEAVKNVSLFIVSEGRLVFLQRADVPDGLIVHHGPVIAREIPNPGGPPAVGIY